MLDLLPHEPPGRTSAQRSDDDATAGVVSVTPAPTAHAGPRLSSAARSIISQRRQQEGKPSPAAGAIAAKPDPSSENATSTDVPTAAAGPGRWDLVMKRVMHRAAQAHSSATAESASELGPPAAAPTASTGRPKLSLAQVIKSRKVKTLVQQSLVAQKWANNKLAPEESSGPSSVMQHWTKTAMLRNQSQMVTGHDRPGRHDLSASAAISGSNNNQHDSDSDSDSSDAENDRDIESAFDVRGSVTNRKMYGRTLLLEESCRRALALLGEHRSQMDLQALKAWFQMSKLKITTDFDRLQPSELDLLCRRMIMVSCHPHEIVFRQGDEGDALYLVFSGVVEVRVSQLVLGEKIEVTVCELSKGDYFGERALLHNDMRAATIVTKTAAELVKISRQDYNIMLKMDQLEFLSRMHMTNGLAIATNAQRTQREYVRVLLKKKNARSKVDIDMLSAYLQTLKFFRGLPRSFVRELCLVVELLTLPAETYVFHEGDVGDLFYIIFSGSVDVIVGGTDARGQAHQNKLINLTDGAHFGELALMKGHRKRSATVITREDCKLLVICEKDYNATLRRMQKEELNKRVGVLDKIAMFQTPEWTGELLKEMSYVLAERKFAMNSTLFSQGEKAQNVYFIVRGELVVTKEITDPITHVSHAAFVQRIGRFEVIGDDAYVVSERAEIWLSVLDIEFCACRAIGATFNEPFFREVTVTASTPVEVLVLSKYDVFHRLSRSARETLRAAARTHVTTVEYLDRFHKTIKWENYRHKVLKEHLNQDRVVKLLRVHEHQHPQEDLRPASSHESGASRPDTATSSKEPVKMTLVNTLVHTNEFLLLPPEAATIKKCFDATNATQSIGQYITTFNADAPASAVRRRQLDDVLLVERKKQIEVLNEGNPLVYFNLSQIQQQDRQTMLQLRSKAASSRRIMLASGGPTRGSFPSIPPASTSAVSSLLLQSHKSRRPSHRSSMRNINAAAAATASSTAFITDSAMYRSFQDDFVFSRPHEERSRRTSRRKSPRDLAIRRSTIRRGTTSSGSGHVLDGELVLLAVRYEDDENGPSVRILRALDSIQDAQEALFRIKLVKCSDDKALKTSAPGYYVAPKGRYAVIPLEESPDAPETTPSPLHEVSRISLDVGPRHSMPKLTISIGEAAKSDYTSTQSSSSSRSPVLLPQPQLDPVSLFGNFQPVVLSSAQQRDLDYARHAAKQKTNTDTRPTGSQESTSLAPRHPALVSNAGLAMFAVVGMVVPTHKQLQNARRQSLGSEEPMLCVYQLLPSETDAMEFAMTMAPPSAIRNAMLCVVPVHEWISLDNVHEWCVQVEFSRREKKAPNAIAANKAKGASGRRASLLIQMTQPEWKSEQDKAHRLHQFICSRLGVKEKEAERRDESGFTPRPVVTLEEKLSTLQEYLQSTAASTRSSGILGKYRQMKRFGSILKARITPQGGNAMPITTVVGEDGSSTPVS